MFSVSAFKWNLLQTYSMQVLNFVSSIIMARLLGPKDYGIVALAMVVISLGNTLMNGGLSQSVLRKENPTDVDYNTLFFLNLLLASILTILLLAFAPKVGKFINDPKIVNVINWFTLTLVVNAMIIVQSTKLNVELNFKKQFFINVPATLFCALVGVGMAMQGYGIDSLIYKQILFTILNAILLWLSSEWRPKLIVSQSAMKEHLKFGFPLTVSTIIQNIEGYVTSILMSKYFSLVEFGLLSRAKSLKELPVSNFSNIIEKNSIPVITKIKDKQVLFTIVNDLLELVYLFFVPIIAFVYLLGDGLVNAILGEKWMGCIVYLELFILMGVFDLMIVILMNALKAKSKSFFILNYNIVKSVLVVSLLIVINSLKLELTAFLTGLVFLQLSSFFIIYRKLQITLNSVVWKPKLSVILSPAFLVLLLFILKYIFSLVVMDEMISFFLVCGFFLLAYYIYMNRLLKNYNTYFS